MTRPRVALIGFGEVGQVLAADLLPVGTHDLAAWDLLFADAGSKPSVAIQASAVRRASSAADAVNGAELVISAVTAAQTVRAAESVSQHLQSAAFFLDLNSASPDAKCAAANAIDAAGGRYVEAAVMSPIHPKRAASPILLGGSHATAVLPLARALGFTGASVYSNELGRAAAAKLCRSVVIKGMEALLFEAMLAARHYGVEDAVTDSLRDLFPAIDWRARSRYMIARAIEHGVRRAEEMHAAAQTVSTARVEPIMSNACARRQAWSAQFQPALAHESLVDLLNAVRAQTATGVASSC